MTKLCSKIRGCNLEIGDEVFIPSTIGDNNTPYEHENLTGTIFALQDEVEHENNNQGYVVAVLLDQDYDIVDNKPFSKLLGITNFNNWEGYEEYVIKKGHVGKCFRWFPIHEVQKVRVRSLPAILERLEREIK